MIWLKLFVFTRLAIVDTCCSLFYCRGSGSYRLAKISWEFLSIIKNSWDSVRPPLCNVGQYGISGGRISTKKVSCTFWGCFSLFGTDVSAPYVILTLTDPRCFSYLILRVKKNWHQVWCLRWCFPSHGIKCIFHIQKMHHLHILFHMTSLGQNILLVVL